MLYIWTSNFTFSSTPAIIVTIKIVLKVSKSHLSTLESLRLLNYSGIFENINLPSHTFLFFFGYSGSSNCSEKGHLQYSIYIFLTFLSVIPSCGTEIHIWINTVHGYIQYIDTYILRNLVTGRKVFNRVPVDIETVHI